MDEDFENPANLSEKSWNRVIDSATKAGYREGIDEGKQSVFQKGFDIGYEDAFETAFMLGKYKGLATAMSAQRQSSPLIDTILEKTRRGACQVCVEELEKGKKTEDDNVEPSIEDVKNMQRIRSSEVLGTLRDHFDILLKKQGLFIDGINS